MVVAVIHFQSVVSQDNHKNSTASSLASLALNPLSLRLRIFILEELSRAVNDATVTSIVLTGGSRNFSAGADLSEFAHYEKNINNNISTNGNGYCPSLLDVVAALDACPKPVVAALAGTCLGGGLEVALACHYRIACSSSNNKTRLGLPEVHVGVIPGAGGTQRLPRLIGLQPALTMILTGKPVTAQRALELGLVDAVVSPSGNEEEDFLEGAKKWAAWAEVMPLQDRRVSLKSVVSDTTVSPALAHIMLHSASLQLPATEMGGQGVHAALEAIRAACTAPFHQGLQHEGKLFLQVLTSLQGRARRHAFMAVRQAQKPITTQSKLLVTNHALLKKDNRNTQVAVIGAGTMGSGIAMVLLTAGFTVWLVDVSQPCLDQGMAFLHRTVTSHVKRGKLPPALAKEMMEKRFKSTRDLQDLNQCILVVEAVVENLKIKQEIFRTLSNVTSTSAILVSNTSTLDINQLAAVVNEPGRVAGWHFFSPAHVMQLVEIVVAAQTSTTTTAVLQALTKRISKIGVVVGNCDGFCGNRMLKPYSSETLALLTENKTSIEKVDAAFLNFGMALGPFQMSDLAGNDIGYNIRRERGWVRDNKTDPIPLARPPRYSELADDMVAILGRLGQKSKKGWYDYDPAIGKGRKGLPSREMADLIQSYSTTTTSLSQSLSQTEMVERVLFPLVNEGFKCLEEGIARSPSDVDVIYLYGYGFPAWRGGPMFWADHDIGLPRLLQRLQEFSVQFPETEHYVPSKLLQECVRLGMTVHDYYNNKQQQQQRGRQNKQTSTPRSRL